MDYRKLEKVLNYRFQNPELLRTALIHRSYTNEHRSEGMRNNERLEFLGDAVLEIVVSDYLYRTCESREGDLSRMRASIVCEKALASWATEHQLGDYLILGHGEDLSGGRKRPSVLSDALEAIFGAIYLDGGFEQAGHVIRTVLLEIMDREEYFVDNKTRLQEMVQEFGGLNLRYRLLEEKGPDHGKVYRIAVEVNGQELGVGEGTSKKSAQQKAAEKAITKIEKQDDPGKYLSKL